MRYEWSTWIDDNMERLSKGEKIVLEERLLGHPSHRRDLFRPVDGFPDGQSCDCALSLDDGSRVHVQCYRCQVHGNALLRVHVDRWDPNHSLGHFVMHGLFETPVGPVLGIAAI